MDSIAEQVRFQSIWYCFDTWDHDSIYCSFVEEFVFRWVTSHSCVKETVLQWKEWSHHWRLSSCILCNCCCCEVDDMFGGCMCSTKPRGSRTRVLCGVWRCRRASWSSSADVQEMLSSWIHTMNGYCPQQQLCLSSHMTSLFGAIVVFLAMFNLNGFMDSIGKHLVEILSFGWKLLICSVCTNLSYTSIMIFFVFSCRVPSHLCFLFYRVCFVFTLKTPYLWSNALLCCSLHSSDFISFIFWYPFIHIIINVLCPRKFKGVWMAMALEMGMAQRWHLRFGHSVFTFFGVIVSSVEVWDRGTVLQWSGSGDEWLRFKFPIWVWSMDVCDQHIRIEFTTITITITITDESYVECLPLPFQRSRLQGAIVIAV